MKSPTLAALALALALSARAQQQPPATSTQPPPKGTIVLVGAPADKAINAGNLTAVHFVHPLPLAETNGVAVKNLDLRVSDFRGPNGAIAKAVVDPKMPVADVAALAEGPVT